MLARSKRRGTWAGWAGWIFGCGAVAASGAPSVASVAFAAPPPPSRLQTPVALTAGGANQFMGQLSAPSEDGDRALYFIDDSRATLGLFVQSPVSSGAEPLFDFTGDIAWPRLSPDGERLAYISYTADAKGDACVRKLSSGVETCFGGTARADVEVVWLGPSGELGVLTRGALHSDIEFRRVDSSGTVTGPVLAKNVAGIAASADGRWFAYVPIKRQRDEIGVSFASRTGDGLQVSKSTPGATPETYRPKLPGVTGYPAFSHDGRTLYFAQYLNDTNGDGKIDGNDHGVIFSVPFDPDAQHPLGNAESSQLTSAAWNCHYPAPAADSLLMTCSRGGSLDVYSLPLGGAVPRDWNAKRVTDAVAAARDPWTELLLRGRLLAVTKDAKTRPSLLAEMATAHLALGEHESAAYYADQMATEASQGSDNARIGRLLAELARHYKADRALAEGQPSRAYLDAERARAERVRAVLSADGAGSDARALASLVLAEITNDSGKKGEALAIFRSVEIKELTAPVVIERAASSGRRIYALRADRKALLELDATFATHPALSVKARLTHSRAYIDELVRGVPTAARAALLRDRLAAFPRESELGLMLDIEEALATLDGTNEEAVRERIFARYKETKDVDHRRALSVRTVEAASRKGNEFLQYQFVTTWASSLRPEDAERPYGEALFHAVVLERAYGELFDNKVTAAGANFFRASRNGGALEAHVGFVEAKLLQGDDVEADYDKRFATTPDDSGYLFAKAYLAARTLKGMRDVEALSERVELAVERLERADAAQPREASIHHLWGYLLHQRALATGTRSDAVGANRHYLLALDLARTNPRQKASALHALGLLQQALGNPGRAVIYFDERARLPFGGAEQELALMLARSQALFDASRTAEAELGAAQALNMADASKELSKYRLFALDRAALFAREAGRVDVAVERYRKLIVQLDASKAPAINRLKARIGLSSSLIALGSKASAREAASSLREARQILDAGDLRPSHDGPKIHSLLHSYEYPKERFAILVDGLDARANVAAGDPAAASAALARRLQGLEKLYAEDAVDEDLHDLAGTHLQMALVAQSQKDWAAAQTQLETGLAKMRIYSEKTGTEVTDVGLGLIRSYAELQLAHGISPRQLQIDVERTVTHAYEHITRFPSPRWQDYRSLFELYLTMLRSARS